MRRGAKISDCGKYRYELHRLWSFSDPLTFIMVNPSTADAYEDDATIRKCIGFANWLGFGGVRVVNLFAYRATDVSELAKVKDPIGPYNSAHVSDALREAGMVVAAWGSRHKLPKSLHEYVDRSRDELVKTGKPIHRLGELTQSGDPRHPLMLAYKTPLVHWHLDVL